MDTIRSETVLIKRSRRVVLGPTQMTPVFELPHGRRRARLVTTICGRERDGSEGREAMDGKEQGRGREERSVFTVLIAGFVPLRASEGGGGGLHTRERVV